MRYREPGSSYPCHSGTVLPFDRGYVTVTPEYRFVVSEQLRDDFDNGQVYYDYAKQRPTILLPADRQDYPSREHLEWHGASRFKG